MRVSAIPFSTSDLTAQSSANIESSYPAVANDLSGPWEMGAHDRYEFTQLYDSSEEECDQHCGIPVDERTRSQRGAKGSGRTLTRASSYVCVLPRLRAAKHAKRKHDDCLQEVKCRIYRYTYKTKRQ